MQLQIRHETYYTYEELVSYSIQSLRLTPRAESGQRVVSWRITTPGNRIEQVDAYGNLTHIVTVEAPHRELRIVVEGVADMDVERSTQKAYVAGEISPLAFLAPTALTRSDAHLRELAERHLGKHPPRLTTLLDLASGVQGAVAYEPGITDVNHTAVEALDMGVGVCQDQAHVFIACCRAAGIPARYVSGYLYTGETGEVASHAWADAWLGEEAGWVSLDVTHGVDVTHGAVSGHGHCRLAVGRDYLDAAPVRGVRRGGGREAMSVAVRLAPFGSLAASLAQQHQQQ